ncbi:MAG: hypothetical protein MUO43_13030 [Desulfobacterales bacterium]|nr:hypothetical protein [Desulfobacterales bacterium]
MFRPTETIIIVFLIVVITFFAGCVQSSQIDSDGDGWTDVQEQKAGTLSYNKDTDGDGYWDSQDDNPLDKNIPISQVTPTVQQSTSAVRPLATVIGKTFVIKNIRTNDRAVTQSIEYTFGNSLIMWLSNGEQKSDKVKISEFRIPDGLYVNLTDFGEALKQTDYPYWQHMTFYDNGYFSFNDYDNDFYTGEWSIK